MRQNHHTVNNHTETKAQKRFEHVESEKLKTSIVFLLLRGDCSSSKRELLFLRRTEESWVYSFLSGIGAPALSSCLTTESWLVH